MTFQLFRYLTFPGEGDLEGLRFGNLLITRRVWRALHGQHGTYLRPEAGAITAIRGRVVLHHQRCKDKPIGGGSTRAHWLVRCVSGGESHQHQTGGPDRARFLGNQVLRCSTIQAVLGAVTPIVFGAAVYTSILLPKKLIDDSLTEAIRAARCAYICSVQHRDSNWRNRSFQRYAVMSPAPETYR
jgi:hypothetical protein